MSLGLGKILGQSVVVDNVPGAGGAIGVHRDLGTRQDAHSLRVATAIELKQTSIAFNVKYRSEDLGMIGLIASSNLLLLGKSNLDVKTPEDLVALASSKLDGRQAHVRQCR
ncbi:hypothetical protein GmRootV35_13530 [Variovorax sp. V35]|uniref:tripartite tricarboxylate transporter substrate-binding protein n=1 Tax=Variovorax sp. V35 TaxID=3065956 RepID=UPI0032E68315